MSRKIFFTVFSSAFLLIIFVSLYWIRGDGIPGRDDYLNRLIQPLAYEKMYKDGHDCQSGNIGGQFYSTPESCIFEYSPGSPTLVLVGDSHAGALAQSVRELARENQLNYAQVTATGCPHISDLQYGGSQKANVLGYLCQKRSTSLRSFLAELSDPVIIYSSRLPLYLELESSDNEAEEAEDGDSADNAEEPAKEIMRRSQAVTSTLQSWVEDVNQLVIVYPVPEQGFHVALTLNWTSPRISSAARLPTLSTSYELFKKRVASSYVALDQVADDRVKRVYPEKIFCREDQGRCIASESERLYFLYDNHVSGLGADLLAREVAAQLNLKVPESFRE